MVMIKDIEKMVERMTGNPLGGDEGVHYGVADKEVSKMTVCWMATPDAIRHSGERGDDLILCHESLYQPYGANYKKDVVPGWEKWRVNVQRDELLDEYGLSCMRIHGSADRICIFDVFAEDLGLGDPVATIDSVRKVYEIPECSLGDLVERVKKVFNMPSLRVALAGDLDQKVKRIGLPWGGLGLFVNVSYQQFLVEHECDVFIAGESDNYGLRFAQECGISMIETSHEISENNGLRKFAAIIADEFPGLDVEFYENSCVWTMM